MARTAVPGSRYEYVAISGMLHLRRHATAVGVCVCVFFCTRVVATGNIHVFLFLLSPSLAFISSPYTLFVVTRNRGRISGPPPPLATALGLVPCFFCRRKTTAFLFPHRVASKLLYINIDRIIPRTRTTEPFYSHKYYLGYKSSVLLCDDPSAPAVVCCY